MKSLILSMAGTLSTDKGDVAIANNGFSTAASKKKKRAFDRV
jgi:hypothetical protein